MSNYRILKKRKQIEKTPVTTRRGTHYDLQKVTRKEVLWSEETMPTAETVARVLIKRAMLPEDQFDPENLAEWRRRPTLIDEKILIQEQRTPRILGWKTLMLTEIGAPDYEPLEAIPPTEDPEPGRLRKLVAFAMANDPVFRAAKR